MLVICLVLFGVCCLVLVVLERLLVARCVLRVVCLLVVVCCLLCVSLCCMVFGVWYVLFVFVVCWLLLVDC